MDYYDGSFRDYGDLLFDDIGFDYSAHFTFSRAGHATKASLCYYSHSRGRHGIFDYSECRRAAEKAAYWLKVARLSHFCLQEMRDALFAISLLFRLRSSYDDNLATARHADEQASFIRENLARGGDFSLIIHNGRRIIYIHAKLIVII